MTTLFRVNLLALVIATGSREAVKRRFAVTNQEIADARRKEELRLGFRLLAVNTKSVLPTAAGRGWTAAAVRVYHKSNELQLIAGGLTGKAETINHFLKLEQVLRWRTKGKGAVERWLGLDLFGKYHYMTPEGLVLEPHLEELCEYIKRLQALENLLRERHSRNDLPMTSPS